MTKPVWFLLRDKGLFVAKIKCKFLCCFLSAPNLSLALECWSWNSPKHLSALPAAPCEGPVRETEAGGGRKDLLFLIYFLFLHTTPGTQLCSSIAAAESSCAILSNSCTTSFTEPPPTRDNSSPPSEVYVPGPQGPLLLLFFKKTVFYI